MKPNLKIGQCIRFGSMSPFPIRKLDRFVVTLSRTAKGRWQITYRNPPKIMRDLYASAFANETLAMTCIHQMFAGSRYEVLR